MQFLIKKVKVFLSDVILKDQTRRKMLKNSYFLEFCPFLHVFWCLQSINSSRNSHLHENNQSLIKKLTFFYMVVFYRRKMGENPQKLLFFVKKMFLFMINYVLKHEELLIPYCIYFFPIRLSTSKLRTKSCHRLPMGLSKIKQFFKTPTV